MRLKKLFAIPILAIAIGVSIHKKVHAYGSIVTSTAATSGVPTMIGAPPNSGQANVLDSCMIGVSSAPTQTACVTIAGQFALDPSFKLCAGSGSTVSMGQGFLNPNGSSIGGITALFGQEFISTGTITAKEDTVTEAGVLVTCSYHIKNTR